MLTQLYIESLIVEQDLADQVWELWNARLISDELAAAAWWLIATDRSGQLHFPFGSRTVEIVA